MTGVTIIFVSDNTINIANATGASVTFAISKLLPDGTWESANTLIIANSANADYSFGTDIGIFKVWNPTSNTGNIIIISSTILTELEKDVKEILLSTTTRKILPKGYDFISLALLSIMFIGNSPYQNVLYSAGNITQYTAIAEAIDRCTKYLDSNFNTLQSTNLVWR